MSLQKLRKGAIIALVLVVTLLTVETAGQLTTSQTIAISGTIATPTPSPPSSSLIPTALQVSSTVASTYSTISAQWTSTSGLSSYIIGTNATGAFVNSTLTAFSGNVSSITVGNPPCGTVIYEIWADSAQGDWSNTGLQTYAITENTALYSYISSTTISALNWMGYNWTVESGTLMLPGPNNFTNSLNSIWIDAAGNLHLKISEENGVWYCSELKGPILGYGTYTLVTSSDLANLDPYECFGFFTDYSASNEIDVEYSNSIGQFTVQPAPYTDYNYHAFTNTFTGTLISQINEYSTYTSFEAWKNDESPNNVVQNWTSQAYESIAGNLYLNLYLYSGHPPANQQSETVVMNSLTFTSGFK